MTLSAMTKTVDMTCESIIFRETETKVSNLGLKTLQRRPGGSFQLEFTLLLSAWDGGTSQARVSSHLNSVVEQNVLRLDVSVDDGLLCVAVEVSQSFCCTESNLYPL